MRGRPLIGVTLSRRGSRGMWLFNAAAVLRAGGWPRRLLPHEGLRLAELDGLVVGGGDDVAPSLYGGEIDPAIRLDPERDALELRALDFTMARGRPVLGICRGAQMVNIARGGTLHADIHDVCADAAKLRTTLPRKVVIIKHRSRLHRILQRDRTRVNALHHQAVDRPGENLTVVARDRAGVVQAIEGPRQEFLIGVQWHPEFLVHDRGQMRLYRGLVRSV
ncbi:MAG: gamma-glutamyl-gamma-aminobutyrate hydrolase family protein [Kiloniellales bacterium]